VAEHLGVSRADQDAFAARSQAHWAAALAARASGPEIALVTQRDRKVTVQVFETD
jgi:acetyl-CoA acyltransferase